MSTTRSVLDSVPTILHKGYSNLNNNMDFQPVRTFNPFEQVKGVGETPSLSAGMLSLKPFFPIDSANIQQTIDYSINDFKVIPYRDVLAQKGLISNRWILVGDLEDETDMHPTPLGKLPGTLIHAYTLQTMMRHTSVIRLSLTWNWLIALILGLAVGWTLRIGTDWTARRHASQQAFLNTTKLIPTIVLTLWTFAVTLGAFLIFYLFDVYVNVLLMLTMIVMAGLVFKFYVGTKTYYILKKEKQ